MRRCTKHGECVRENEHPAECARGDGQFILYPQSVPKANDRQVGGQHYQMPIQPWDFIVQNEIPFLEATAIVYVVRHRRKHGREDLEKAIHYLQKAIEIYYPEGA